MQKLYISNLFKQVLYRLLTCSLRFPFSAYSVKHRHCSFCSFMLRLIPLFALERPVIGVFLFFPFFIFFGSMLSNWLRSAIDTFETFDTFTTLEKRLQWTLYCFRAFGLIKVFSINLNLSRSFSIVKTLFHLLVGYNFYILFNVGTLTLYLLTGFGVFPVLFFLFFVRNCQSMRSF